MAYVRVSRGGKKVCRKGVGGGWSGGGGVLKITNPYKVVGFHVFLASLHCPPDIQKGSISRHAQLAMDVKSSLVCQVRFLYITFRGHLTRAFMHL